jgi:PEP-CTERM motif
MRMHLKLGRLATCAIAAGLVLVAGNVSRAQSVIIGNFETPALDNYDTDGTFNSPSPTLSQGTVGVTLGSSSLESQQGSGGSGSETKIIANENFWGPATGNLANVPGAIAALGTPGATLSYNLNLTNAYLNGDPTGQNAQFNSYAQSNVIAITLFGTSGGTAGGLNIFAQETFSSAVDTDSSGQNATWSGVDGNRELTWALSSFTGTDPANGQTETLAQIIDNPANVVQDSKIGWSEQGGEDSPVSQQSGPLIMFWDDVQLNVPEPASLSLLGFSAIGLIMRRNRKA